ncbi:hypothetical protein P167DRAFT_549941 [Morchella conica CCBAS932]|uniref:Uncharacterized protein n=1 Tax=Morchella conica CCBAS932 TaxID=1392247 RepID=A0A3N4KFT7_9PEZI|nr:hypothetical protein P167DRAFT_549941 [Morchella conica CCBAS932]
MTWTFTVAQYRLVLTLRYHGLKPSRRIYRSRVKTCDLNGRQLDHHMRTSYLIPEANHELHNCIVALSTLPKIILKCRNVPATKHHKTRHNIPPAADDNKRTKTSSQ